MRITLVNHSTALLQVAGANLLTDPIWSRRAGPLPWLGPRRRRQPGVRFEDLPPLEAVLISHNHYDHLDLSTLRQLAARGGHCFIVPAGVGRLLRAHHIAPVFEMDWGDALPLPHALVHCVPALHFSARGLFDRNRTLWCGYLIEASAKRVFYAGDTAFGPHFAWIRERFGEIDAALLPIGAYAPRWFMSPVHMAPEEAIQAHAILGAKTSIAIHHGTFQLADEALDAPPRELAALAGPAAFLALRNGQFVELG